MDLVKCLIALIRDLEFPRKPFCPQKRAFSALVRRLQLLSPFFEEILDSNPPLPPSCSLAWKDLISVLHKTKSMLVATCSQANVTGSLLNPSSILAHLQEINSELACALEAIPMNLLEIPEEVKEQVLLLKLQAMRSKWMSADPAEQRLRVELTHLLQSFEDGTMPQFTIRLEKLFIQLGMSSLEECELELARLGEQVSSRLACEDIQAVDSLRSLASFVRASKRILYGPEQIAGLDEIDEDQVVALKVAQDALCEERDPQSVEVAKDVLPDEFRCPISLEMMNDPVIIATGQTYDRDSIQKWISAGRSTCPKSGQKLIHLSLIPNYALRSLLAQWCELHSVKLKPVSDESARVVDRIQSSKDSLEVAKVTAAFLVGKLATGSAEVQQQVAYELRLLAKCGSENRICIAEAGAIPFLVPLLSSADAKTQANAVTALLNLSIHDNNKRLVVSAGGLDPILAVLSRGSSMEARQNAAATIFSLSTVDEYKAEIGSRETAITSLVTLLREGSCQAKKDATSGLFNLLLLPSNRDKVVQAGAVPVFLELVQTEQDQGLVDDSLAALALVCECEQGISSIGLGCIPILVAFLLRPGGARRKENSLSVLLALCKNGGGGTRRCVASADGVFASLQELLRTGTPRARRKATSLLKLFPVASRSL